MAQVKIVSVDKRLVTVDVVWDDGLVKNGLKIPDVPVESFADAQAYLLVYISGAYNAVLKEQEELQRNNPVIDPMITAAIGHTFDNEGNMVN